MPTQIYSASKQDHVHVGHRRHRPRKRRLGVVQANLIAACAAVTLSMSTPAQAAPMFFAGTGHYYEYVSDPFVSWFAARDTAAASSHLGELGHLATITSQAENDFLRDLALAAGQFSGFSGAWIGGRQPLGWLTGPEAGNAFTYTNWGGIEPNNNGYAYMSVGTGPSWISPGEWLDDSGAQGHASSADPVRGYFVEYSGNFTSSAVPEPSSFALLGIGTAGVWFVRRRRRAKRNRNA